MVSAETLTDEQIREVYDTADRERELSLKSDCMFATLPDARVPHGHEAQYARLKLGARARIAAAINARKGK